MYKIILYLYSYELEYQLLNVQCSIINLTKQIAGMAIELAAILTSKELKDASPVYD